MTDKQKTIVITSGGFDPIHSGHILLLKEAKELGDILIVGVNSDNWLIRKKGLFFLPWIERSNIVESLKPVDYVYSFDDDKKGSAIDLLQRVIDFYPYDKYIFANGGDRNYTNIPESDFCRTNGIDIVSGIGGSYKANSSSDILNRYYLLRKNREIR